ncbi:MAG: hypothetical protein ACLR23_16290 [Clostridia bacterium]
MLLFLGSLFVSYGVGVLEEPLLALIANSSVRWIVQSFLDSLLMHHQYFRVHWSDHLFSQSGIHPAGGGSR